MAGRLIVSIMIKATMNAKAVMKPPVNIGHVVVLRSVVPLERPS